MKEPTTSDIEHAYAHARWLRPQNLSGSDRMLADLGYEVQRLRKEQEAALMKQMRLDWLEAMPCSCLKLGKMKIYAETDAAKVAIVNQDGEGGEMDAAELGKVVEAFFRKHF